MGNLNNKIYEFYSHIGYTHADQKQHQNFYVKYFEGCSRVLDLACGKGQFLELLDKSDIKGVGIEKNEKFFRDMEKKNLDVICDDVLHYLENCPTNSYDGIICSHFIEHLPYEKTLELVQLSHKILKEGGKILIVTPNVKSLSLHLGDYYRDYSHVAFYHVDTIEFFLLSARFAILEKGEHPLNHFALFGRQRNNLLSINNFHNGILSGKIFEFASTNLFGLLKEFRRGIEKLILRYFFHSHIGLLNELNKNLLEILEIVDKPSECYVYAKK